MTTYRVRDWDDHFENSASRKLKRLDWIPIPNKMHGEGYTALVDHPNGAAHLGAWLAIVEIASMQTPRGSLPNGIGGICRSLSRISRLPVEVFEEALPRLVDEIGWIERIEDSKDLTVREVIPLGKSANVVAESASTSAKDGGTIEGNRREGNRITGNRTTHTHTQQRVRVLACDLDSSTSQRFPEFWDRWPVKQNRDVSARIWLSLVTVSMESKVFECLDRFLSSDQVARGVVGYANNWLEMQHRDGWTGDWPRPAPANGHRKLSVTEEAKLLWEKQHAGK